jgi:hypothetical protein
VATETATQAWRPTVTDGRAATACGVTAKVDVEDDIEDDFESDKDGDAEDEPVTLVVGVEVVSTLDSGLSGRADGESTDGLPAHDVASRMQATNTTARGRLTPRAWSPAGHWVKHEDQTPDNSPVGSGDASRSPAPRRRLSRPCLRSGLPGDVVCADGRGLVALVDPGVVVPAQEGEIEQ